MYICTTSFKQQKIKYKNSNQRRRNDERTRGRSFPKGTFTDNQYAISDILHDIGEIRNIIFTVLYNCMLN